jgi:membrane-associated phospholipid phosphatase
MLLKGSQPLSAQNSSPFELNRSLESIIIGSGLAIGGAGWYLDKQVKPLSLPEIDQLSVNNINRFDRIATRQYSHNAAQWSDILVGAAIISPITLFIDSHIRNDFTTVAMMYAQTTLLSSVVPGITKVHIQRVRPYVYNAEVPMDSKLNKYAVRSFYSGHTTNAFASMVFLSVVYSDYFPGSRWEPYVWTGSLGLASMVGYLRYRAGRHFPTDILVGAAVGSTIGFLIPYLHRQNDPIKTGSAGQPSSRPIGINIVLPL